MELVATARCRAGLQAGAAATVPASLVVREDSWTLFGFSDDDEVFVTGIVGMEELNGRNLIVDNATANTFKLASTSGGGSSRICREARLVTACLAIGCRGGFRPGVT